MPFVKQKTPYVVVCASVCLQIAPNFMFSSSHESYDRSIYTRKGLKSARDAYPEGVLLHIIQMDKIDDSHFHLFAKTESTLYACKTLHNET